MKAENTLQPVDPTLSLPAADSPSPAIGERHATAGDLVISSLLRYGVLISVGLVLLGTLDLLLRGNTGYGAVADVRALLNPPADHDLWWPNTLSGVVSGAAQLRPYALILLGLLVLIMTPVMRVAVSALLFLREHDLLYVAITVFVLCVLVLSFFLGIGHG